MSLNTDQTAHNQEFIKVLLASAEGGNESLHHQIIDVINRFCQEKSCVLDKCRAPEINRLSDLIFGCLQRMESASLEDNLSRWWNSLNHTDISTAVLHDSESNSTIAAKLRANKGNLQALKGHWGCDLDFCEQGLGIAINPSSVMAGQVNILKPVDVTLPLKTNLIGGTISPAMQALAHESQATTLLIPVSNGVHWNLLILRVQNKINTLELWDPLNKISPTSRQLTDIEQALKADNLCVEQFVGKMGYGTQENGWSCFDLVAQKALSIKQQDTKPEGMFHEIVMACTEKELRNAIAKRIAIKHNIKLKPQEAPLSSTDARSFVAADSKITHQHQSTKTSSMKQAAQSSTTSSIVLALREKLKIAVKSEPAHRFDEVMAVLNKPENEKLKAEFIKHFVIYGPDQDKERQLRRTLAGFGISSQTLRK